jgi:transposase-like protein
MLKAIHAAEDRTAALQTAQRVVAKLKDMKLARAAELVGTSIEETLAYYSFPETHWRRIRTNNPLERISRMIRSSNLTPNASPHAVFLVKGRAHSTSGLGQLLSRHWQSGLNPLCSGDGCGGFI